MTEEKATLLPADGIILASQEVSFAEGDTVFDILLQLTKKNKIHMEFSTSPLYETRYIEGIQNLYEFDCGDFLVGCIKLMAFSRNMVVVNMF